jgi:hypothetical protein
VVRVSDLARVYVPGTEPAKGSQTGGLPEQNGKERASTANGSLAHDYHDDRTK